MANHAKGVGKGIDTEGVSLVGNVVFCDRAKCTGDFDVSSGLAHGRCNVHGVPDEGTDATEAIDRELTDARVRRETAPNQALIRLGFVVLRAAEILTEPFSGSKYRAKVRERMHST
jgi:hypothetical protein